MRDHVIALFEDLKGQLETAAGTGDAQAFVKIAHRFEQAMLLEGPDLETDDRTVRAFGDVLERMSKRGWYGDLLRITDSLLARGFRDPIIAASQAQALLDMDTLVADRSKGPWTALKLLAPLCEGADVPLSGSLAVAIGMMARAYKDLMVDAIAADDPGAVRTHGQRALACYRRAYEVAASFTADPRRWLWRWPATNGISLAARLIRLSEDPRQTMLADDWVSLAADIDHAKRIGRETLHRLNAILASNGSAERPEPWDYAAKAELLWSGLLGGEVADAAPAIDAFVRHPDVREFELTGTLRQFHSLLSETSDSFVEARTKIRLALSERFGRLPSVNRHVFKDFEQLTRPAGQSRPLRRRLEASFPDSTNLKFQRLLNLVAAARSVAALSRDGDRVIGTGFLVDGGGLAQQWAGRPVFLSCDHVWAGHILSSNTGDSLPSEQEIADALASQPPHVLARFEAVPDRAPIILKGPLFRSSVHELDVVILPVDADAVANIPKLRIAPDLRPQIGIEAYVIGHPGGRDLSLSMEARAIVSVPSLEDWADGRFLFHKASTEQGNSGSPVLVVDPSADGPDDDRLVPVAVHSRAEYPIENGAQAIANIAIRLDAVRQAL